MKTTRVAYLLGVLKGVGAIVGLIVGGTLLAKYTPSGNDFYFLT